MLAKIWWQRYRWTLLCIALALMSASAIGLLATAIAGRPAPIGSRSSFYTSLFFAIIGAAVLLLLLLVRGRQVGLPALMGALAFLPSRTGMQWKYTGFVTVSVTDLVVVLGTLFLVLYTKVLRPERLRTVAVRVPLWVWVFVAPLGLLIAGARGVPWTNYVPELKGFYLWILIVVLCVNVLHTAQSIRLVMAVLVLSAIPNVVFQLKDVLTGATTSGSAAQALLANGDLIVRTSGGAGLINQYAFSVMVVFFLSLALAMTALHWITRFLYYGCAIFFVIGIGLTYTRGAWIATAAGLLVVAALGEWRVRARLATGAAIGYFLIPSFVWQRLNFSDNSVAERVAYLHTATATVQAYPLLGGGWGSNFELIGDVLVPLFRRNDLPFWHNDYLIVATQVGLPGLAVFLWIWASLIVTGVRAHHRAPSGPLRTYLLLLIAAVVAMFTQAFTDMFYWRNETGPLIWLVVGLICATLNLIPKEVYRSIPT